MHIENLEARALLSSVTYKDHVLSIIGSPGRDRIRIDIFMDAMGSSAHVLINGHGGVVRGFGSLGDVPERLSLFAARGNDTIKYHSEFASFPQGIDGGSGNDRIDVVGTSVLAWGGGGNDIITLQSSGANPNNRAYGSDGNDRITALYDDATLRGGNGDDTLIGGAGDDRLSGDSGRDILKGGGGIDTFFGGPGDDRFYTSDDHRETVNGGAYFDRVFTNQNCDSATHSAADVFLSIEKIICR